MYENQDDSWVTVYDLPHHCAAVPFRSLLSGAADHNNGHWSVGYTIIMYRPVVRPSQTDFHVTVAPAPPRASARAHSTSTSHLDIAFFGTIFPLADGHQNDVTLNDHQRI